MKSFAPLLFLITVLRTVSAQEAVFFFGSDSSKIRAELYLKEQRLPFIILCPADAENRDEFTDIAPGLLNLNYNCLEVHLNSKEPVQAMNDVNEAIRFVQKYSLQPVILFGSLRSASVCLLTARNNNTVKGVIALNPGEYFMPFTQISRTMNELDQPVLVVASRSEFTYIREMMAGMNPEQLTIFLPEKENSFRGTGVFKAVNEQNGAYWFALMMYFKKLDNIK